MKVSTVCIVPAMHVVLSVHQTVSEMRTPLLIRVLCTVTATQKLCTQVSPEMRTSPSVSKHYKSPTATVQNYP